MATSPNPFDQFDAPKAVPKAAEKNTFDQFDAKPAPMRAPLDPRLGPAWGQTPREQMSHVSNKDPDVDPNVDYSTGVPDPKLTAELSILTKPEQRNLLVSRYGADNIDTDMFGNWVLKPGAFQKAGVKPALQGTRFESMEMPVAIIPKDRWTLPRVTSHAGEVLPTVGAMAGGTLGGVAGMPTGPANILPAMEGAALGGAAGESGNALIAQYLGIADRRPTEQLQMTGGSAAGGMIGEGGGRLLSRFGRAALGPYAEFAPLDNRTIELTRKALDKGIVPRVAAANPKAFLGAREQGLIEAGFGFPAEKKNIEILRQEGQKLIEQTGGAPGAVSADIIKETQRKMDSLALDFNRARNHAAQTVDDSIQALQAKIGKPGVANIQQDIDVAYKGFQEEAGGLYGQVDKFTGGKPVVPTAPVRKTAQEILDSLPKTKDGQPLYDADGIAIKFLRNMTQLPEMYSMRDMQALRSQLASSAEVKSLLSSTGVRNAEILRQSTNDAFDSVGQALKGKSGPAVDALRKADAFYSEGMNKFDVPIVRKLMTDARATGHVAPEKVLEVLTMPNSATNIGHIMGLVTPETRNAVRRAHFDSMLNYAGDPITGEVSGIKLANQIKSLKSTFPALYGRDAQSIQTLANQLAALDGKLDLAALKSGNITTAIKQAIAAEKAFKDVSDDELFGALSKPGFESATTVDHLFKPGHPERITRAIKFFGEDSKEVKNIRALAMGKILESMEATTATRTGVKQTLSGKQLEDTLKLYGKPTVEAMFGKDASDALHEFAAVAEMATAKNPKLASIDMAQKMLNFTTAKNIRSLAELYVTGQVMSSPKFIRWLTEGFKFPPPLARGVKALTRADAYTSAISGMQPGIGGDSLLDKEMADIREQMKPAIASGQQMLDQPIGGQQQ